METYKIIRETVNYLIDNLDTIGNDVEMETCRKREIESCRDMLRETEIESCRDMLRERSKEMARLLFC